ncbi:MAG: divalent-cation tolerance protein CutA [Synechococcus lacustris]
MTSACQSEASVVLALTTEADAPRAEALARLLLDQGLAACVSLRPVQSLYHWQGNLESSSEVELLIKTSSEQLQALERLIHENHSYELPEWLHWPVNSSPGYGRWLQGELKAAG